MTVHSHAADAHPAHADHPHVNYFAVFWTLIGLTALTVGAFYVFHSSDNELVKVLVALLIASVKAICVAWFFMHLKFEGKLIYAIFLVPLGLCVLLVVALIPDVLYTRPERTPDSTSLHHFNDSLSHYDQPVHPAPSHGGAAGH